MMEELDIHPASLDERKAAFANVFEFWRSAPTLEEHVAWRLTSAQHQRATWYVGTLGGSVVTSLGAYPMMFVVDGSQHPGIAIGAVHTRPEHRGKGFAEKLLSEVERQEATARGATVSILFSDIRPEYYARFGYLRCPSRELDLDPQSAPTVDARLAAQPFKPDVEDRGSLEALYRRCAAKSLFWILRDKDYWAYLARKSDDQFLWILRDGERIGFARVGGGGDNMMLRDFALDEGCDEQLADLVALAAQFACDQGAKMLRGWIDDTRLPQAVPVRDRDVEITMIKSLPGGPSIECVLDATAGLREIDHV